MSKQFYSVPAGVAHDGVRLIPGAWLRGKRTILPTSDVFCALWQIVMDFHYQQAQQKIARIKEILGELSHEMGY